MLLNKLSRVQINQQRTKKFPSELHQMSNRGGLFFSDETRGYLELAGELVMLNQHSETQKILSFSQPINSEFTLTHFLTQAPVRENCCIIRGLRRFRFWSKGHYLFTVKLLAYLA